MIQKPNFKDLGSLKFSDIKHVNPRKDFYKSKVIRDEMQHEPNLGR